MSKSSRAVVTCGFGLVALVGLVTASRAQSDAAVRKTNGAAAAAPASIAPTGPIKIGTIDIEKVLKEYKKVKSSSEEIRAQITAKQGQLAGLASQGKQLAKELEGLDPNSADAKTKTNAINKLRIQLEADREAAQADFARQESEALAGLYKEIQDIASRVAKMKGLTFVVRTSNEPISASEPNSVMSAMARTIVYADPSVDITDMVVHNLNLQYDKLNLGKPAAKAATAPAGVTPRGN